MENQTNNRTEEIKKSMPMEGDMLAVALVGKAVQAILKDQLPLDFTVVDRYIADGNNDGIMNLAKKIHDEIENSIGNLKEHFDKIGLEPGMIEKLSEGLNDMLYTEALKLVTDNRPLLTVAMVLEGSERDRKREQADIQSN